MNIRYLELDALRGIAAVMVVFFHYSVRYGQLYSYQVEPLFKFDIGLYGVQLFFIISGFAISLTLEKTTHAVDFMVSRFSRLYPAYWAGVILTFAVVYWFSLPGREVDIKTAVINMTMLQTWFNYSNVDGVYWTLTVELCFYLIMWFLFAIKAMHRINVIALFWLLLIIGYGFVEKNGIYSIHWAVKLLLLLNHGALFIAGIMFFRIMHAEKLADYLIILLCLAAEYYLFGELAYLIAVYFLVFFLFSKNYLRFIAIKPLVFLGTISYSLYLIHQNIGYVIINAMRKADALNSFNVIVLPLMASIFLAALMQRYIEKPSLTFVRNRWQQSRLRTYLTNKDGRER